MKQLLIIFALVSYSTWGFAQTFTTTSRMVGNQSRAVQSTSMYITDTPVDVYKPSTTSISPLSLLSSQKSTLRSIGATTAMALQTSAYHTTAWKGDVSSVGASSPIASSTTQPRRLPNYPGEPNPDPPVPLTDIPYLLILLFIGAYIAYKKKTIAE